MSWRVVVPTELDETQRARWRQIQKSEPNLNSPFFNPEFTMAAAADRPGARVAILEDAGQIVAFFPFEKDGRIGEPIGRQLSDFHAVIASPQTDWDVVQMMRACGLVLWEFKNLMAYQKPLVRYHQGMSRSPAIGSPPSISACGRTIACITGFPLTIRNWPNVRRASSCCFG